jgi:hypothetical protein
MGKSLMRQTLHVANTYFEFELADYQIQSLEQGLQCQPACLQLQFLPVLFAAPQDVIGVTLLPPSSYIESILSLGLWQSADLPIFTSLQEPVLSKRTECQSWGMSRQVAQWAKKHHILYEMPDWEVVKQVNSKAFSFAYSPEVKGRSLVRNSNELDQWLATCKERGVLKTCFGVSGRGNCLFDSSASKESLHAFCQKEWKFGRPVIAEPWLFRLFDFSTQWFLHPHGKIEFIGATVFETDARGTYAGTLAGSEQELFGPYLPFLREHQEAAQKALEEMVRLRYFGFAGIDAFLYQDRKEVRLYPVVEINARQTMSLAALQFQKKWFPEKAIQLAYASPLSESIHLLPSELADSKFKKQLTFKILR